MKEFSHNSNAYALWNITATGHLAPLRSQPGASVLTGQWNLNPECSSYVGEIDTTDFYRWMVPLRQDGFFCAVEFRCCMNPEHILR